MTKENIAVRAILVRDGKVALGLRGHGIGRGEYALIGGKPDQGETLEEAVSREVQEEVGVLFTNPIIFTDETSDSTIPGQFWHTYYFTGDMDGQPVADGKEVVKIIYAGPEDLSAIDIAFVAHKKILEMYFASQNA